jgi:WNK lysine deficient protein kinase
MSLSEFDVADEETSPDDRYVKNKNELLGRGAFKEVYKAYDREKGIEVAWNQVSYINLSKKEKKQLKDEVIILYL